LSGGQEGKLSGLFCAILCAIIVHSATHTHMNRPNNSLDWVLSLWAHFTVLRFIFVYVLFLCLTVYCMHVTQLPPHGKRHSGPHFSAHVYVAKRSPISATAELLYFVISFFLTYLLTCLDAHGHKMPFIAILVLLQCCEVCAPVVVIKCVRQCTIWAIARYW